MSDDEFEEALSYEPELDFSQNNGVDGSVVPLDPSEDAHFSEQQFSNIQERLSRINTRILKANYEITQLQHNLRAHAMQSSGSLIPPADMLAGGDNPLRGDETEAGEESEEE